MKPTIQKLTQKQTDHLVSIKEAGAILNVTRQSIYHYRLANILKPVPTKTSKILFDRKAVEELKVFMDNQKSKS